MPQNSTQSHVAIVGGGLVGSLAACLFAKRGYHVDLYESRSDIRKTEHVRGKSINLALSVRGIAGLQIVGLKDKALSRAIPMEGRLIHDINGHKHFIRYGDKTQAIYSIERRFLNEILLDEAEKNPNVNCHFNNKLVYANLIEGNLTFSNVDKSTTKTTADLIVGCDGAFSTIRRHIKTVCNFSQIFLDHGYMEFTMPPNNKGEFAMESNCLHIWPRDNFMLIALPNLDRTYTVTLFMPLDIFDDLNSEIKILNFFQNQFPDALPLLGEKQIVKDYLSMKASYLLTVKCNPINVKNKALILGDAAHAMAPFYGQGMNCGFEDCEILNQFLDNYNEDLNKVLPAFSEYRCPDIEAICDLALYNYVEMRHLVNTRSFIFRKYLDRFLYFLFPNSWVPLYTMVTFSRTRYHQCIQKREWQDKVISRTKNMMILTTIGLIIGIAIRKHDKEKIVYNTLVNLLKYKL